MIIIWQIRVALNDRGLYETFLRILVLYNKSIISKNELLDVLNPFIGYGDFDYKNFGKLCKLSLEIKNLCFIALLLFTHMEIKALTWERVFKEKRLWHSQVFMGVHVFTLVLWLRKTWGYHESAFCLRTALLTIELFRRYSAVMKQLKEYLGIVDSHEQAEDKARKASVETAETERDYKIGKDKLFIYIRIFLLAYFCLCFPYLFIYLSMGPSLLPLWLTLLIHSSLPNFSVLCI